jgi:hypothetical protein
VRLLSDFFEMVDLFVLVVTILSIFYFWPAYRQLFPKEAGNETLGHDEGNGLVHFWKKMPLPMKILFVIVDVGFLLAALYYFGFV